MTRSELLAREIIAIRSLLLDYIASGERPDGPDESLVERAIEELGELAVALAAAAVLEG
jgi:hypothetical protein